MDSSESLCTEETVAAAIRRVADIVAEHHRELTELDRAIGDADHGENLNRGFVAVISALDEKKPDSPAAVLKLVATTLISTVGGAAGPLYGTAFLRAATAVGDRSFLDVKAVSLALQAALEGVKARGKAVPGDATMVDALAPAVSAAELAAERNTSISQALRLGAEAADNGAESTVDLVARKGRASYLGERAIGHMDPGARSTALILHALARTANP